MNPERALAVTPQGKKGTGRNREDLFSILPP